MWTNPQETADLVTVIEEILNGKLRFFFSDTLRRLDSEADLRLSQTSMVQFFTKIVNGLAVNYLRKKLYHRCLTGP